MNEVVTAWTPLIVALFATGTALASGIGPAVRYARLEKLLASRTAGESNEKVDLLIDVLASGLIVEENSVQQRTRIWWAIWTGALFVAATSVLLAGFGLIALDGVENDTFRLIGLAGSLVTLPLFSRSLWALFRPRPMSLLIPRSLFSQVQPAVRATERPEKSPAWWKRLATAVRSKLGPTHEGDAGSTTASEEEISRSGDE